MTQKDRLRNIAAWASYYRANPQRFASEFMNLRLKLFQKILLYMMNKSVVFVFIACRGLGKTFLSAIYCCIRAILYPGSKIVIASGTRGQSINVLEKIILELVPRSDLLRNEIESYNLSQDKGILVFKNTSFIKVVTAAESARSARANVLLIDEFRLVDKATIDAILKKFLIGARHPGYLDNPKYAGMMERNIQIYLSSAYYKSHWSFDKFRDTFVSMLDPARRFFVCDLTYQLLIKEGLLDREQVEDDMRESTFNEVSWSMEMCGEFFGDDGGSFFSFNDIVTNRKINYPMMPKEFSELIGSPKQLKIPPKQPGEKRIISADIALMSSKRYHNDASAIFVNQLLPTKHDRYINNIVYTESSEGANTQDQALRLRKLYAEFECDYLVLDVRGVGAGVGDCLVRDIIDPTTGEVYPALSCCNDPEWAARCKSPDAEKAIWAISATGKFNNDCALLLREGFKSGKIRLLVPELDGEKCLSDIKGYKSLTTTEKLTLQLPYLNTTLLINELIKLDFDASSGTLRVIKHNARKDRYSSLSYNHYVACQLEQELRTEETFDFSQAFIFRAPIIGKRR